MGMRHAVNLEIGYKQFYIARCRFQEPAGYINHCSNLEAWGLVANFSF